MNVSFASFPVMPAENNIFYHTGNPDLSTFTCDISAVNPAGLVECNITDIANSNVRGDLLVAKTNTSTPLTFAGSATPL